MNVRFTGRHIAVEDEDRAYALKRVEHLARFHPKLVDLEVRVDMDGAILERVELEAGIGHHMRAVASAEAPEFRAAFDQAVDSLKRQLVKDREKRRTVRRRAAPKGAAAASRRPGGRSRP
jgi:ribosomal subunit interface protein